MLIARFGKISVQLCVAYPRRSLWDNGQRSQGPAANSDRTRRIVQQNSVRKAMNFRFRDGEMARLEERDRRRGELRKFFYYACLAALIAAVFLGLLIWWGPAVARVKVILMFICPLALSICLFSFAAKIKRDDAGPSGRLVAAKAAGSAPAAPKVDWWGVFFRGSFAVYAVFSLSLIYVTRTPSSSSQRSVSSSSGSRWGPCSASRDGPS